MLKRKKYNKFFAAFLVAFDLLMMGTHVSEWLQAKPAEAAATSAKRVQWEYMVISEADGLGHPYSGKPEFQDWLNARGQEGWELADSYRLDRLVLKRRRN